MSEALKLVDVWKIYRQGSTEYAVLKGVNLTVERGELLVVMGPSGSGKTTLLTIAGTLDRPSRGRVYIGGYDVTDLNEERLAEFRSTRVGFVFQSYNLLRNYTALENVMLPMIFSGRYTREEARKRAYELLKIIGLEEHAHKFPSQLSGGQQQRVAIARALANDPDIVLMDEPTGNLDLSSAAKIMSLVKWLNEVYGQTFMIVTHNPELAELASRVVYIRDGILYDEPPKNLLNIKIMEEIRREDYAARLRETQIKLLRVRALSVKRLAKEGRISPDELAKEVELLRYKIRRIKARV